MSYDFHNSMASQVFRGISEPAYKYRENSSNTKIIDIADKESQNQNDKTGVTIAFEDFSEKFKDFHGENKSNISAQDCEKGFFQNLFEKLPFVDKSDNIYETDEAQEYLEEGNLFQGDIFDQEITKNNGIKYAQDNSDIYASALNFAQADIGAVEQASSRVYDSGAKEDKKLNYAEIGTYFDIENTLTNELEDIQLDKDAKTLSSEEYASYLIAADENKDGLLSTQEAQKAQEYSNSEFKELAQEIYDKNYNK